MDDELLVGPDALGEQVRGKYREVAVDPGAGFDSFIAAGQAGSP